MKSKLLLSLVFFISCFTLQAQNWDQIIKTASSTRLAMSTAGNETSDNFGYSVAIDGDYAVVGNPYERQDEFGGNSLSQAGAVYIFKNSFREWKLLKKILPLDRETQDLFGSSVAISQNTIIVGAPGKAGTCCASGVTSTVGAAYIFSKDEAGTDNWGLIKKLEIDQNQGRYKANFGNAVAINLNTIVIGAENYNFGFVSTENTGIAYIYSKNAGGTNNWGLVKSLEAPVKIKNTYFGSSVSISNSTIVVGAHADSTNAVNANPKYQAGAAYIFSVNQGGGG